MSSSTSATSGSDESIKIGYVRRAHGIKGAVIVRPLTDDPARFDIATQLVTDNQSHPTVVIATAQPHKDGLLVSFEGIHDRNQAELLRGTSFVIDIEQRRDLDSGEYWPDQLIGLSVVDAAGAQFGIVADIVTGTAQDRLQVQGDGGLFEVPFVAAIVTEVNVDAGVVVVDMPDGMAI